MGAVKQTGLSLRCLTSVDDTVSTTAPVRVAEEDLRLEKRRHFLNRISNSEKAF